jgi:hypothetical protein
MSFWLRKRKLMLTEFRMDLFSLKKVTNLANAF